MLPQVNAGAGEVAKVFLSPSRLSSELMLWQGKLMEAQQIQDPRVRSAAVKSLYEEKRRIEEATYKLKVRHLCLFSYVFTSLYKTLALLSRLHYSPSYNVHDFFFKDRRKC